MEPLFKPDGRDLRQVQTDAFPGVSLRSAVQVDLIDPTHGLALGCEAALPCLFDFAVDGTANID